MNIEQHNIDLFAHISKAGCSMQWQQVIKIIRIQGAYLAPIVGGAY
jgi:hypothetical protein